MQKYIKYHCTRLNVSDYILLFIECFDDTMTAIDFFYLSVYMAQILLAGS